MLRPIAAAILFVFASTALAGDLPRDLISAYRPAVENTRAVYGRATVRGTISVELPQSDKFREQEFILRASGDNRRLDVTTVNQRGMGLQVGGQVMTMTTPAGSLTSKTAPGKTFFGDAQQLKASTATSAIDNGSLLHFAYSLGREGTIADMLLKPSVTITAIKKIKVDDRKLVRIEYEETERHRNHTGLWKSYLLLDPAQGWALLEFNRTSGHGSDQVTHRAALQYSGLQSGAPIVRSIEYESLRGSRNQCVQRDRVEVTQFKAGDPDPNFWTSFAF